MYTLTMSRLVWNMFCLVRGCARPKARGARVGHVRGLCLPAPPSTSAFFFNMILWFSVCPWFFILSIAWHRGGELLEGCLVQCGNVPCVFLGHFQAFFFKALVCAGRQQWCAGVLDLKGIGGGGGAR